MSFQLVSTGNKVNIIVLKFHIRIFTRTLFSRQLFLAPIRKVYDNTTLDGTYLIDSSTYFVHAQNQEKYTQLCV